MAMEGTRSRSSSSPTMSTTSTSKPLHNFVLPCGLKWGNQRFLRCMKVNSNGEIERSRHFSSTSSSSSPTIAAKKAVSNGNILDSNVSGSKSIAAGKRKQKDKFDDGPSLSSQGRGSDCRKPDFNFKLPPLPSQRPPASSSSATESCRKYRSSETRDGDGDGDGIAAVRKKLMIDLQTAADEMKVAILQREGLDTEEQENPPSPSPSPSPAPAPAAAPTVSTTVTSSDTADASVRPWNLRTRRAACKEPTTTTTTNGFVFCSAAGVTANGGGGGTKATAPPSIGLTSDGKNPNSSLSALRTGSNKSQRLRNGVSPADNSNPTSNKRRRPKFSVSLTRQEIEEDFLIFANRKPARRPHKRNKYVQRELDTLFPGLSLSEITPDIYKVSDSQQQ